MRKVLAYAALGFALSVSLSSVAGAQGGRGQGRGFGGFGGGLFMLRSKEVQTELKMTEAQVAKLDAKQQELQDQMRELRPGGGGGDRPTREEMQAMMAKRQELQTKAVSDILDTKQMKRYRQLELQQSGVQAFQRKDVADELKITSDQQAKIRDIQQAQREEMRNSGGFNPNATPEEQQAFFKKMQDMQKATSDKIVSTVLTDAQRKQWKEMQGEPFKFPPFQFGGPGGRRGGGGNPPPAPPVA